MNRSAINAWALGAVGVLVGASIVTIALCDPDVCTGVGKPWEWPWDAFIAVSFLGAGGIISIQSPTGRLAPVVAVVGVAKLVEMNAGAYGDPAWWQVARMVFIALVWHAALSYPTGDPRRVGWVLSGLWASWAIVGGALRFAYGDPATMASGGAIDALASSPDWAVRALEVIPRGGDALIVASLVVLIGRMVGGDRQTRRAMAPLLVIVPIVVLTVVDEALVDAGVATTRFLEASQWVEFATLAVPWGIVAGLARSRLWGGQVAGLVAAAESASTPDEVERVAADTLEDPSARLGLVRPGTGALVGVDGRPFPEDPLPGRARHWLTVDRERIGVLDHATTVPAMLAEQTAATIALAVDRQRLQAEVRAQMAEVVASRRRVVAAADDARRRVERDLHDGAQQRLLALSMEAERLRRRLEEADADPEAVARAEHLVQGTKAAHKELRDLARGMYPPVLEADGLAAALDTLADQAGESGPEVVVDAEVGRLPREVEGTFYFAAAEAITNAMRHAGASSVAVAVTSEGSGYLLEVIDDGRGGAEVGPGSGLLGLTDRVNALGGTMAVDSPPGGPTRIAVRLPG